MWTGGGVSHAVLYVAGAASEEGIALARPRQTVADAHVAALDHLMRRVARYRLVEDGITLTPRSRSDRVESREVLQHGRAALPLGIA